MPPLFTEPGWNLHTPEEIGLDALQANRGPEDRYRTTPLGGLFARAKCGFYHDGRFPTLDDVVEHYDGVLDPGLTAAESDDLFEYLSRSELTCLDELMRIVRSGLAELWPLRRPEGLCSLGCENAR